MDSEKDMRPEESAEKKEVNRLFVRVTRDTLPRVVDKYPFLYLEHGRLEIDDSSIRWIDAQGGCVRLPVATISCLLLGPGTSVTHEAVKTATAANCSLCWVGEDSLLFYAAGTSPVSHTRNMLRQARLCSDPESCLAVARAMFSRRFPDADIRNKSLQELMGMEGQRVRDLYLATAQKYGVGWKGRSFVPGKFELSDTVNKILTACNAALYGIICSVVHSLGYSPHLGFVHSGSPLPFVYDMADLYKGEFCIEPAFSLCRELAGRYDKHVVASAFRDKVIKNDLLACIVKDMDSLIGEKNGRRYGK
ncbi:MAG TPA: type I-E CRISPR-associated endonuclease Cas1e [Candidatus Mailhella merdavium]|nr:type I-E CRISPR-associated endonuclease Cas1e [Candidatus Mailhella merdavium]